MAIFALTRRRRDICDSQPAFSAPSGARLARWFLRAPRPASFGFVRVLAFDRFREAVGSKSHHRERPEGFMGSDAWKPGSTASCRSWLTTWSCAAPAATQLADAPAASTKKMKSGHAVVGAVVVIGLGAMGLSFPSLWPLALVAGAVLVIGAVMARPTTSGELLPPARTETNGMQLPTVWDERQISLGMERYRGDGGLLSQYVDGIVSRFVMGQDIQTMEVRSRYLETFNRYAAIARESYKWHRYLQGGRAKLEEDLEDMRLQIRLQQARNELDGTRVDPELVELQRRAQRVELMLQIAQTERAISDLNRPAQSSSLPTPGPSPAEVRRQRRAELDAREKEVREAIRITRADPTLEEEQKQRKLNNLDERLAQIHEEQTALL